MEDPYLLNEDLSPAAEYNASLSSPPLDGHSSQKALFRKKEDDNPYEIRDEREEEDEHFGENGRHSTVSLPRSSRLSHTPPPKRQSFPQALHLSNSTADASSNSSKGYITGRGKSALSFGSDEDKGGETEEDPYALLEEIEGNRDDSFAVSDEDGRGHDARNKSESPPYRRNHLSFNDRIDGEEDAGADLSGKYEGDASSLVESSQPSTAFHTPMKRGVLYSSSLSSSISAHGKSPPLSLLTNDEELDRPAPPLQPQPVASSRFSVSPKFRAYTTVIQPSTPSPRTRGLRSSLSSFASAIRHSFSHEDINSVQPAKMNVIGSIGEPFRADGKQNAGLVSSYTQLLMFNWKALLAGCETLNLDQEMMMPEDGNIEEGYIEGGMLHDAAGFAEQLSKGEQWSGIVNGLMRLVRAANNQFLRRWMLLFASLRRCMPQSIRRLKPLYRADMHDFWKAQMILHTNCISDISHRVETAATDSSGTTIPNYSHSGPHQELSQLRNLIEMEQASSRDALSIDNGDATLPARELHLYDPAVHKVVPSFVSVLIPTSYISITVRCVLTAMHRICYDCRLWRYSNLWRRRSPITMWPSHLTSVSYTRRSPTTPAVVCL